MGRIIIIVVIVLGGQTCLFGQAITDSFYNSWSANKARSIFSAVDSGVFYGTANGYIQLENNKDTIILDFQATKTKLNITHDPNEMYDNSTKLYSTKTTSDNSTLTYETYALANILTIKLNGSTYSVGSIDGAADMPISGLSFNYCADKNIEYLTLYVNKPIELTTIWELMQLKKINYPEAKKFAKTITLIPGSTVILILTK